MSIEIIKFPKSRDDVYTVHLVVSDELNLDDCRMRIIPQILTFLDNNQKISFFLELHNVGLWQRKKELISLLKDHFSKTDIMKKLIKIAVIGDSVWYRAIVLTFSAFLPIKYFNLRDIEVAKIWLNA